MRELKPCTDKFSIVGSWEKKINGTMIVGSAWGSGTLWTLNSPSHALRTCSRMTCGPKTKTVTQKGERLDLPATNYSSEAKHTLGQPKSDTSSLCARWKSMSKNDLPPAMSDTILSLVWP
jgi:hypothetical protein